MSYGYLQTKKGFRQILCVTGGITFAEPKNGYLQVISTCPNGGTTGTYLQMLDTYSGGEYRTTRQKEYMLDDEGRQIPVPPNDEPED